MELCVAALQHVHSGPSTERYFPKLQFITIKFVSRFLPVERKKLDKGALGGGQTEMFV